MSHALRFPVHAQFLDESHAQERGAIVLLSKNLNPKLLNLQPEVDCLYRFRHRPLFPESLET